MNESKADVLGENYLVSELIWLGVQIKTESATVDSCFIHFGTRQYGVAKYKHKPITQMLMIFLIFQ